MTFPRPLARPLGWHPTHTYVPDRVPFTAPCPEGHLAEWTAARDDCRSRAEVWCPVCEAASPVPSVVSADLCEWGPDGRGPVGPESGSVRPSAALRAGFIPVEGAA